MKYKVFATEETMYSGQKYTRYHVHIIDGGISSEASNADPARALHQAISGYVLRVLPGGRTESRLRVAMRHLGLELGPMQENWVNNKSGKWFGHSGDIAKEDGRWYLWPKAVKSFMSSPYRLATVCEIKAFNRPDFSPTKWARVLAAAKRLQPGQTVEL